MKRFYFFLFFILASLVFFSCAKKEKIVAQIGDEKIILKKFDQKFKKAVGIKFDSPEQELAMRKNFLNRLIEQKILVAGAYEQKMDTIAELNKVIEAQKRDLLIKQLYEIEVLNKAVPTEKELKDYYKKLSEEIHLRHILVKDESEAKKVYERLMKGEEFEKLASEFSQDTLTKDKGGDLGFFIYDRMFLEFREVVFKLKERDISKPVKTFYGWHVIKVEEKRKREQKPYEEIKDFLKTNLQRTRQQELGYGFIEELKERLHFEVVSETKEKLLAPFGIIESGDSITLPLTPWDPTKVTPEDKELILATYDRGELKVSQFLEEFNKIPFPRRPRITDPQTFDVWVYQLFVPTLLHQEAIKRGLDKSEEYKEALEDLKEQKFAENMKYGVLFKEIDASDEEIKEYYEKNKEMFVQDAEVHVREIMVRTKAEAEELLAQIKAGADFSKLAGQRTVREHVKARGGDLGYIKRTRYPEIFDYAMKMKKGKVGGPVSIQDFKYKKGWSIIELLDKKGGRQKGLDEVRVMVKNTIKGEKKMKIFDEFLSEMKKKLNVEIYEDVLENALITKPE